MNPACLPVCHPTTPEQLTQASQVRRALPVINTYLYIILYHTIIHVYTLISMLTHGQIKL